MSHYTVDGFPVPLDAEREDRAERLFAMLNNIKTEAAGSFNQLDELEVIVSKSAAAAIKRLRTDLIETVASMTRLEMALLVKNDQ